MMGFERVFDSGNDPTLHREGLAGNSRPGRGRVAAAAEKGRDFVDVHLFALGTKTNTRQFRFDFLENACNDYWCDGANVIDQPFGIAAIGAGASEIGFFQPKVSNLILVRETKVAVNVAQQAHTGERVGLINFIADFCQVSSAADKFTSNMIRARARVRILERTGVGGNRCEKAISDLLCNRPFGCSEELENKFAGRGLTGGDPVDIAVASIALVMIDIDENLARRDARADGAEPFETCGISCNHAIELLSGLRLLDDAVGIQESVFFRGNILIPAGDLFALVLKGEGEA